MESEEYGVSLVAYLALNPVRAGLVDRPEAWPWSSYSSLIGLTPEWTFVKPGFLLGQFDADRLQARAQLREYVESVRAEDFLAA